jgi:hypothetical protein
MSSRPVSYAFQHSPLSISKFRHVQNRHTFWYLRDGNLLMISDRSGDGNNTIGKPWETDDGNLFVDFRAIVKDLSIEDYLKNPTTTGPIPLHDMGNNKSSTLADRKGVEWGVINDFLSSRHLNGGTVPFKRFYETLPTITITYPDGMPNVSQNHIYLIWGVDEQEAEDGAHYLRFFFQTHWHGKKEEVAHSAFCTQLTEDISSVLLTQLSLTMMQALFQPIFNGSNVRERCLAYSRLTPENIHAFISDKD